MKLRAVHNLFFDRTMASEVELYVTPGVREQIIMGLPDKVHGLFWWLRRVELKID